MFTIKEVKTKKQQKEFVEFPIKLYKKCPYFVPPLYGDEIAMFKKDYHYYDQAESIFFNAYDENNKMVGRIQGILQNASNEKWNQKRVRFTRFDCIDNQEVANLLFNTVENWAKGKNMEENKNIYCCLPVYYDWKYNRYSNYAYAFSEKD